MEMNTDKIPQSPITLHHPQLQNDLDGDNVEDDKLSVCSPKAFEKAFI